jgi:hypothetical protein
VGATNGGHTRPTEVRYHGAHEGVISIVIIIITIIIIPVRPRARLPGTRAPVLIGRPALGLTGALKVAVKGLVPVLALAAAGPTPLAPGVHAVPPAPDTPSSLSSS